MTLKIPITQHNLELNWKNGISQMIMNNSVEETAAEFLFLFLLFTLHPIFSHKSLFLQFPPSLHPLPPPHSLPSWTPLSSVDFVTYREDNSISCSIGSVDRQSEISCGIRLPQDWFSPSLLLSSLFFSDCFSFSFICLFLFSVLFLPLFLLLACGLDLSLLSMPPSAFHTSTSNFLFFCGIPFHALSSCPA